MHIEYTSASGPFRFPGKFFTGKRSQFLTTKTAVVHRKLIGWRVGYWFITIILWRIKT